MTKLGHLKPAFHFGRVPGNRQHGEYRVLLPFRRPWPLIIILAVFTAIFSFPLFTVFSMPPENINSLFALMFFLFTMFWMLGWGAGVFVMFTILCALLFARERLVVRRDTLLVRLELFGIGVGATYMKQYISNLGVSQADTGGNSWRGNHVVFDYFDVPVSVGSHLDLKSQMNLINRINQAFDGGVPDIRHELPADAGQGDDIDSLATAENIAPPITNEEATEIRTSSSLLLILANLVPVAGVFFLGWKIGDLMLIFWVESAVIGLFNAFKLFKIGRWSSLFYVPFFVGHFGGFMAVHLIFVFALFVSPQYGEDLSSTAAAFLALWPAIISLFISHGYSFMVNFLGKKEYVGRTIKQQMSEPYKRIIVMHLTILFGGFLVMVLSNTLAPLLLLIGLKLFVDLYAHHREHSVENTNSVKTG